MIEVKVSGLGKYLATGQWLLLLKEERTAKYLAVVISPADTHAISHIHEHNRWQKVIN